MTRRHTYLVNMWMLKAPNGMYWYARDYASRIGGDPVYIIRRGQAPSLHSALGAAGARFLSLGFFGFARVMLASLLSGRFVYTPTPHPVPFIHNQVVVVHDAFPFSGRLGGLKAFLFRFGLATSKAKVAHINRSICLPFLRSIGIPDSRLLFAPNAPPRGSTPSTCGTERLSPKRVLGAFGTDSSKKRYELLFQHPDWRENFDLKLYGQDHSYVRELRSRFGAGAFEFISSSNVSLDQFLSSVDGVLSVAEGEGFGRPLATAILAGKACYLLASPAFIEFFGGTANIYESIDELIEGARRADPPKQLTQEGFLNPAYLGEVENAAGVIQRMADV